MHARTVWDRLQRIMTSPSVEGIPCLHHITVLGLCACSCCHDRKCFCEFNQRDLPRQLASLDCSIAFSEIKLFYLFHQISVLCTLFTNTSVRYFILTLTYFYHFFSPLAFPAHKYRKQIQHDLVLLQFYISRQLQFRLGSLLSLSLTEAIVFCAHPKPSIWPSISSLRDEHCAT